MTDTIQNNQPIETTQIEKEKKKEEEKHKVKTELK